jgi:segregation and condensation protein B
MKSTRSPADCATRGFARGTAPPSWRLLDRARQGPATLEQIARGGGAARRRPYHVTGAATAGPDPSGGAAADALDAARRDDPRLKTMRLEAVLLLAKSPLNNRRLAQLAALADATEARTLVRQLNHLYRTQGRALRVEQVAGGNRMMTHPALAPWLAKLGHLPAAIRLSTPMMETLAVVAYRQPVSRASAEAIRGVACGELLRQLMERDLIRVAGRSEELGRPYLYGTTKRFLQLFGLPSADALPPIQWQTLQDEQDDRDPDRSSLDSTPEDLSTSPKESVVSTAVESVLAEADHDSPVDPHQDELQAPSADQIPRAAVDDDDDEEGWDEEEDDEYEDDGDLDEEWDEDDEFEDDDEEADEVGDEEGDEDEELEEEELDEDEEDEWQEVDDDDDEWDDEDDEEDDDWEEEDEDDDDDEEWD